MRKYITRFCRYNRREKAYQQTPAHTETHIANVTSSCIWATSCSLCSCVHIFSLSLYIIYIPILDVFLYCTLCLTYFICTVHRAQIRTRPLTCKHHMYTVKHTHTHIHTLTHTNKHKNIQNLFFHPSNNEKRILDPHIIWHHLSFLCDFVNNKCVVCVAITKILTEKSCKMYFISRMHVF